MEFIPELKIGLGNAWWFNLAHFSPMLVYWFKPSAKETTSSQLEKKKPRNWRMLYMWAIWLSWLVLSVFTPFKLNTYWFYLGLPLAMLGLVTFVPAAFTFVLHTDKERPLTVGMYRYSRHPQYVTQTIMFLGVSIMSASWLYLVFTIAYNGLSLKNIKKEEQACLKQYGEVYEQYINKTHRWLGWP